MTPLHLTIALQNRFRDLCGVKVMPPELPGYEVWEAALEALGALHDLGPVTSGMTTGYAGDLAERGEDPEHIMAIFTLVFLT